MRATRLIELPDDGMVAVLRAMTGTARVRIADDMFEDAARMIELHVRRQHPEWAADRIRREVARRMAHEAV